MEPVEKLSMTGRTLLPMPPEIAAGIVKVQASIKRLAKESENRYSHYNYASIDAFLEAVGPLEAEAGIFTLADEVSEEVVEVNRVDRESGSSWLKIRWSFTLGHASGVLWGPIYRTVMVPAVGAQAYGSAMSYALKQFQRALYKIPTGDGDDPDAQEKQPLPRAQQEQPPKDKRPPRKNGDAPPPSASPQAQGVKKWGDMTSDERLAECQRRLSANDWTVERLAKMEAFLLEHKHDLTAEHFDAIVKMWTDKREALDANQEAPQPVA